MKWLMTYDWMLLTAKFSLLAILAGFLTLWVSFGSPAGFTAQVASQRIREQRIVKDALVLMYRTDKDERVQALTELQDTLPVWEQVQRGLMVGDKSLGLPRNVPGDIELVMVAANADYTPMDIAVKKILSQHDPVDSLQIQIIQNHDPKYVVSMYQVSTLWQKHVDEIFLELYWIEFGLVGGLLALVFVQYVLVTKPALKRIKALNEKEANGILEREIKEEDQPPK